MTSIICFVIKIKKYYKKYCKMLQHSIICIYRRGCIELEKRKWNYRNIAISCKAKDLVDKIAEVYGLNRGAYVERLIEKDAAEKGIKLAE
jgi:hypothetical protein